jgi:phospho-N-acetylmuramoyl-pentapeptide-transferase
VQDLNPWWVALASGLLAALLFGAYRLVIGARMAQRFREIGPDHHKLKGSVPTGTGIIFVVLLLLAGGIVFIYADPNLPSQRLGIYVCWCSALMGLLGWVDDSRKVKRGSEGLRARYKFPVMILVGLLLLFLISTFYTQVTNVPGFDPARVPWPVTAPWWLFYPVGLFVWLGALNGANFTDGLDGLLSCTTLVVLSGVFYALLDGREPLAVPAAVGFGALVAFLIFNWKPALIYMGDTGSLTVGALVAGLFIAKGWWLFLGLCAVVWVIEVASVMLQVASYKTTGRRILLMSPLHHHFELAGWGERRTVLVFSLLQVAGCLVAFVWLREGVMPGLIGLALLLAVIFWLVLRYNKRVR